VIATVPVTDFLIGNDIKEKLKEFDAECEIAQEITGKQMKIRHGRGKKRKHDQDKQLTTDPWILDIIKGYKIEFETLPQQRSQPKQLVFSAEENNFVQQEMQKFLEKGIV
jgi:hypothetical protein